MPRRRSSWNPKSAPRAERPASRPANGRGTGVATRPSEALPAAGRSARPVAIAAIVGATLLVFVISLGFLATRGSGGAGLDTPPGPPSVRPAAAFRAVYRVVDSAGPTPRPQTDVIAVQRPDDVRIEHRDGPPPGGAILSGSIVTRTSEITLGGSGDGFTTPHAPAILEGLLSLPALEDAAADGKAKRLGEATVLGERCTRYSYDQFGSDPLGSGDGQFRVESCVTDDDIMLREIVDFTGREVRRSEAVQVDRSPSFGPTEFATTHPITPTSSDEVSDDVTEGPPDGVKALTVQLPGGFTLDRRANVGHSIGPDTQPILYYAQSYVGNGEQIIIEQPLDPESGSPWTGRGGSKIDIGNGQPSEVLYRTGYVEIETKVANVPVRVLASSKDLAVYVARELRMPV